MNINNSQNQLWYKIDICIVILNNLAIIRNVAMKPLKIRLQCTVLLLTTIDFFFIFLLFSVTPQCTVL